MMFAKVLIFLAQTLLLIFLVSFNSKPAWRLAVILQLLYVLLVIKILDPIQFYFASALSGFALYFFFVFYNIAHFEETPQERRGYSSALMFSLPPLISITAPIFAGFVASINKIFLWVLTVLFFFLAYYMASKQIDFSLKYNLLRGLREIKATRWFIFIEGMWEAMLFGIIPISTLYFIKEPLNYGLFLAYLSAVGIIANLLLGRFTDKVQKRSIFLYPLTIIMAIITLAFTLAIRDIYWWTITTGALAFTIPLFWNISTALVVDAHPNLRLAIPARELLLAIGRTLGLIIAFLSFVYEKTPYNIFFVLGGVLLFYPLILFWNTKISKKYSYL